MVFLLPVLPRRSKVTGLPAGTGYVSSACGMAAPLPEGVHRFKRFAPWKSGSKIALTYANKT
jgi:hypothetical protein